MGLQGGHREGLRSSRRSEGGGLGLGVSFVVAWPSSYRPRIFVATSVAELRSSAAAKGSGWLLCCVVHPLVGSCFKDFDIFGPQGGRDAVHGFEIVWPDLRCVDWGKGQTCFQH